MIQQRLQKMLLLMTQCHCCLRQTS